MQGIFILFGERRTFEEVLHAIEKAFPSIPLKVVLLTYYADIGNVENATGIASVGNRIARQLPLDWRELMTIASCEEDPQECSIAIFASQEHLSLFEENRCYSFCDVLVECSDFFSWSIYVSDECRMKKIAAHFSAPVRIEPSHIEQLLKQPVPFNP